MQLSEHFSLAEMTASETAKRIADPNQPDAATLRRMKALCEHVLEPVRLHFGRPVRVNSGYRALRVNRAVGSNDSSQHPKGEAGDIEIDGVSNIELARWIRDTLDFDQLILEAYRPGQPNSGWVHVSWRAENRRGKAGKGGVLTMKMGSHGPVYQTGIVP